MTVVAVIAVCACVAQAAARGSGRGRGLSRGTRGGRGRGRGRNSKENAGEVQASGGKGQQRESKKAAPKQKAKASKQKQPKAKAMPKQSPMKRQSSRTIEVQVTPVRKKGSAEVGDSPLPANAGKFLNSARRRASQKRQEKSAKALQQLRQAGLPDLVLPGAANFRQQSFTATRAQGGSSIGVILGTTSFYVYHATVPAELQSFVHNDRKGGVSIGWTTFHGPRIAWLGLQSAWS